MNLHLYTTFASSSKAADTSYVYLYSFVSIRVSSIAKYMYLLTLFSCQKPNRWCSLLYLLFLYLTCIGCERDGYKVLRNTQVMIIHLRRHSRWHHCSMCGYLAYGAFGDVTVSFHLNRMNDTDEQTNNVRRWGMAWNFVWISVEDFRFCGIHRVARFIYELEAWKWAHLWSIYLDDTHSKQYWDVWLIKQYRPRWIMYLACAAQRWSKVDRFGWMCWIRNAKDTHNYRTEN